MIKPKQEYEKYKNRIYYFVCNNIISNTDYNIIMKTKLQNQIWLKEHQITAFWHGFGIANGLTVSEKEMTVIKYKDTPKELHYNIKAEYMQSLLIDYISWLKKYGESWNDKDEHSHGITTEEEFVKKESESKSRSLILEMIDLLQKYKIE